MSEPVRVYIERVKAECGVRTDQELGNLLGYSKQAIANWRRRDSIPAAVERRLITEFGPRFALNPILRRVAEKRMNQITTAVTILFWSKFVSSLKHSPSPVTMLSIADTNVSLRLAVEDTLDALWDEGSAPDLVHLVEMMMHQTQSQIGLDLPMHRIPLILGQVDLDGNEIDAG
jgi:Bacteriophage CI repressor helix-turn-helix domain